MFEAPAFVAGFDDFAMMGEAVEERSCHLGVDDGVEPTPGFAANAGSRDGYGQMRLAGAGSADQHSIALFGQKAAACQIADERPDEEHLLDSSPACSLSSQAGGGMMVQCTPARQTVLRGAA